MVHKIVAYVGSEALILFVILFIPFGLLMDLTHELGHVLWGIAVEGKLVYLKIAYFEIYPNPALTTTFVLGHVQVSGLRTEFAHGLFLLGGSLTSDIVAWLSGLLLLKFHVGYHKEVALKILGLFGILDLPLYVFFPQIGLQHWVLLGGNIPEPLTGARNMGIGDPAFYTAVAFSTLGLLLLYSKGFRNRTARMVAAMMKRLNALDRARANGMRSLLFLSFVLFEALLTVLLFLPEYSASSARSEHAGQIASYVTLRIHEKVRVKRPAQDLEIDFLVDVF
jgi:hypothetical protein